MNKCPKLIFTISTAATLVLGGCASGPYTASSTADVSEWQITGAPGRFAYSIYGDWRVFASDWRSKNKMNSEIGNDWVMFAFGPGTNFIEQTEFVGVGVVEYATAVNGALKKVPSTVFYGRNNGVSGKIKFALCPPGGSGVNIVDSCVVANKYFIEGEHSYKYGARERGERSNIDAASPYFNGIKNEKQMLTLSDDKWRWRIENEKARVEAAAIKYKAHVRELLSDAGGGSENERRAAFETYLREASRGSVLTCDSAWLLTPGYSINDMLFKCKISAGMGGEARLHTILGNGWHIKKRTSTPTVALAGNMGDRVGLIIGKN